MEEPSNVISWAGWQGLAVIFLVYNIVSWIHHAYFDSLAHIPGPRWMSASRLPYVRYLLQGSIVQEVQSLHQRYGPVVRIAPNEVSFASPQAWTDILTVRPGHQPFIKDPTWWAQQPGRPESLLSTPSLAVHARMRKTLSSGFTASALRAQETIILDNIKLLLARLREKVETGTPDTQGNKSVVLDLVPWFNYVAFDIFGDLAFGESFGCLINSELHPWISLLFYSVKAAAFVISARFYPAAEYLLMKCIPRSMMEKQMKQYEFIAEKVQRRLGWETQRADLLEYVKLNNDESTGMSVPEIQSTFAFLANAGSETTATTLAGIFNYLMAYPDKLTILSQEVRSSATDQSGLTMKLVEDLPYLNAVINEGLRLCPPVPTILPRLSPHSGDLVDNFWIPGGTSVSLAVWAIHRDERSFQSPATFNPERWLPSATSDKTSMFYGDSLSAVKAFSCGPRSCLGRNLALAELRLTISYLVWNFEISRGAPKGKELQWDKLKCFLLWEKEPVLARLQVSEHI